MALIDWKEPYSVNIKKLDDQHKTLVQMINTLHDAMREGKGSATLGQILDKLINYAAEHFRSEESLFTIHQYPDLLKHKREHEEFVKNVVAFKHDFESGRIALTLKVMNFLKEWLIKHILGSDKEYTHYLNAKGVY